MNEIKNAADSFLQTIYKTPSPGSTKTMSINEKMAIYGMVRYPDLRDRDLCDKIDIKVSTFTAIKNRLKKYNLYRTIRIPNFERLGMEILLVGWLKLVPRLPPDKRRLINRRISDIHPNIFFFYESGDYAGFVSFLPRYTDAKDLINKIDSILIKNGIEQRLEHNIFPLKYTYLMNIFDFTSIVAHIYEDDMRETGLIDDAERYLQFDPKTLQSKKPLPAYEMNDFEKQVYLGLIKYSSLPDKTIAEKIGVTRQSVARMKSKFSEANLYFDRRILDLRALGLEIFVMVHATLHPEYDLKRRIEGIRTIKGSIPMIFWGTSNLQSTFFCTFRNYEHFQEIKSEIESYYVEKKYLLENPLIIPLAMPSFRLVKGFKFIPMLENLFDTELND